MIEILPRGHVQLDSTALLTSTRRALSLVVSAFANDNYLYSPEDWGQVLSHELDADFLKGGAIKSTF